MVRGIEKFKEYFENYTGQYVFIGGTACDIILGSEGIPFRQTKDLDMVLIIEVLSKEFVDTFVRFIQEAGYEHVSKGSGNNQFYRFDHPQDSQFPYMIELFSRKPAYLNELEVRLSPIHVSDDVVSLSAILLDDAYYTLLTQGVSVIDGIAVLNLINLVLFKMKAWLDLSARKEKGEKIDTKNIKKHKNDVIRLVANMNPETVMEVSGQVKADVLQFLAAMEEEKVDLKALGIRNFTYEELLKLIKKCFSIEK